jgi:hypothetical protein
VTSGEEKTKKNLRFVTVIIRLQHILFCLVMVSAVAACSKGSSTNDSGTDHIPSPNDTIPPRISIFTPTVNQVFMNGSVINITGKITDELGLYRGTIRIINDATSGIILNQPYEIHGLPVYDFSISHTASVTVATDYTVTVTFEDHGLNSASKSVKVKVNP